MALTELLPSFLDRVDVVDEVNEELDKIKTNSMCMWMGARPRVHSPSIRVLLRDRSH